MAGNKNTQNSYIIYGLVLIIVVVVIGVVVWLNTSDESSDETSDGLSNGLNGLQYENPQLAADFTLTNQDGNPVTLSDYRGKVVMMYFGFTNCPEQCPVTMGIWGQVQEKLGDKADDVQFLFVTIDPLRDSVEQVAEYLSKYPADITGLTGSLEEIEDVATDYSVFFETIDIESGESDMGENDEMADMDAEHEDDMNDMDTEHDDSEATEMAGMDADHDDMGDMDDHEHEEELEVYDYWVNHTALTFVIDKEGKLVLAFPYATSADDIVSDLENWLN